MKHQIHRSLPTYTLHPIIIVVIIIVTIDKLPTGVPHNFNGSLD